MVEIELVVGRFVIVVTGEAELPKGVTLGVTLEGAVERTPAPAVGAIVPVLITPDEPVVVAAPLPLEPVAPELPAPLPAALAAAAPAAPTVPCAPPPDLPAPPDDDVG